MSGSFTPVTADDFGGDVLGISRAPTIADDQQPVTGAEPCGEEVRNLPRACEHPYTLRRSLKYGE